MKSRALIAVTTLLVSSRAVALDVPKPGQRVDVGEILRSLSLQEKVGQLIMIGFGGTEVDSHIKHWISERKVGGAALFSRNIKDFDQVVRFTRDLHGLAADGLPLFLALDQEGGNVVRVKDGAIMLPGNMALGATRSTKLSYLAGQALAIDLRRLGFNMNLAPVLDVNSNPRNPVIGIRSYGERPELVAEMGSWYIRGQQEMGVVAVAKHFPGHGDTKSDSHFAMPVINADYTRLSEVELLPFKYAMDAGLDAVMTAHITLPKVAESSELPATLSKIIITDMLRKRLGFRGVVITDGLEMQGIIEKYGSGRAAVLAIRAGADMAMILWTRRKKEEVYQALLDAVKSGEISERRLNRSVRRILRIKSRRGLFKRELHPVADMQNTRNRNPLHENVVQRIASESVTLVRNHADTLPIQGVRYRKVVAMAPSGEFASVLAAEKGIKVVTVPYIPSRQRRRDAVAQIVAELKGADLFVPAVVNRYHVEMVRQVMSQVEHVPVAMFSFASPYYLESVPSVDAYVCTYSYRGTSQRAAAEAALGRSPMVGRLPVSIPGHYMYGHRVETRMATTAPPASSARSLR